MYAPPHSGEIVREECLKALGLRVTEAAKGWGECSADLRGRGLRSFIGFTLPNPRVAPIVVICGVFRRKGRGPSQRGRSATLAAKVRMNSLQWTCGEDYLYHKDYFLFVDFPPSVTKKILALQSVA